MQNILKYVFPLMLLALPVMMFYRVFHGLTKINSRIYDPKIDVAYLEHKDSSHYAFTFRVDNYEERLGIYIGTRDEVSQSRIINLFDTTKLYTILIDESMPTDAEAKLGVREVILNGKQIYKESQATNLGIGILFTILSIVFLIRALHQKEEANNL